MVFVSDLYGGVHIIQDRNTSHKRDSWNWSILTQKNETDRLSQSNVNDNNIITRGERNKEQNNPNGIWGKINIICIYILYYWQMINESITSLIDCFNRGVSFRHGELQA